MSIQSPVPSRTVLSDAVRENSILGHENLGFLSEERGLAPVRPPLREMPDSHRAWDEIIAELPNLLQTLRLRQIADQLPVLSAAEESLPDEYLLRASALMSMLAHAYVRVRNSPPDGLPASIEQPWQEVTRRLGRQAPVLSYIDLIIYNWRLRDPDLSDPMRVENLELLIPTVGNREEEIFHLTQIEILAQCAPIVGAVIRSQEAITRGDVESLEQDLLLIIERLQHVGEVSFQKIDPNPRAATFVDPVVWAKTVAPFAVPITPGVQGPSGTSSPIFHLMDVFLGRASYESVLGVETLGIRNWYPRHWLDFLAAVSKVSLRDFVEQSSNRRLQGVFQVLMDTYASDKGFLGIHRLKVYGYLETAFKMGRSVTIGGFSGLFREQTWTEVDQELANTRDERYLHLRRYHTFASRVRQPPAPQAGADSAEVRRISFDVTNTGVRFRPGDRCGVLAENSQDLIDKTLRALRASGEETIRLDRVWRQAVGARYRHENAESLPLAVFLTYGKLRPVQRHVAKTLYRLTASSTLRRIINERSEDQWELWDLLDLLYDGGFDTRRLWKAEPWEAESICKIIPPESYRLYSISSAIGGSAAAEPNAAESLELTVRRLAYQTRETATSRAGTRHGSASTYLHRVVTAESVARQPVALKAVAAPRFHLPANRTSPVVMFAGGVGIAPFHGFMQERSHQADSGENWLFFGIRTLADFLYRDEIEQWIGQRKLNLRIAFSAEDLNPRFDPSLGHLVMEPGERGRIDAVIEEQENARILWDLLRSEEDGGKGAFFYVCGQSGFSVSVMESIQTVIQRFCDGENEAARAANAKELFYQLFAERRYLQDIFTTYSGVYQEGPNAFNASDLVIHNSDDHGFWIVIDGRVYDMTEFVNLHPGGHQIIRNNIGADATRAYHNVMHHLNSEVDAMLGMYEIGHIRRLTFKQEWGIALGEQGLFYVSLEDAFKHWVRYLYLVVEMENALTSDFGVIRKSTTRDEPAELLTPLKIQMASEAHRRFLEGYVDDLLGDDLQRLWAETTGLCAPMENVRRIRHELDEINASPMAAMSRSCADIMQTMVDRMVSSQVPEIMLMDRLRGLCWLLDWQDRQFLSNVKMLIRDGVIVFETHEDQTITLGGQSLVDALRRVPAILREYYAGVAAGMRAIGVDQLAAMPTEPASGFAGPRRKTALEIRQNRTASELPGHGTVLADLEAKRPVARDDETSHR